MSLIAKETGTEFEICPVGTHLARCVQVIDLGTIHSKYYDKWSHKVVIGWEIPGQLNEDGKPFLVWKRYTLSLHTNSGLRKDLESWRSRAFTPEELGGFDLKNILTVCCMINIGHNDGFANVTGVMAVPGGMEAPAQLHQSVFFNLAEFDKTLFDTFSEKMQKTIMSSKEMRESADHQEQMAVATDELAGDESEVPF